MTKLPAPRLLLVLLCAACASGRTAAPEAAGEYLRLLDVEPQVGARIEPDTTLRVRAAYRLPAGEEPYVVNLLFLTETGSLVSAAGARPVPLAEREGVVELSAVPASAPGTLRRPLTALIMIMGEPGERARDDAARGDDDDLPPAVREHLERRRDSAAAVGAIVRTRAVATPAVLRSRAIFYNGSGPAPGNLGPALPFHEAVAEYRTYGGEKALALAVGQSGRRTWGSGFGFPAAESAIERALHECEQSVSRLSIEAACQIYAVGDSIPTP